MTTTHHLHSIFLYDNAHQHGTAPLKHKNENNRAVLLTSYFPTLLNKLTKLIFSTILHYYAMQNRQTPSAQLPFPIAFAYYSLYFIPSSCRLTLLVRHSTA